MNLPSFPILARRVCGAGCVAIIAVAALSSGGCADIVTYAGEARQSGIKHYNAGNYAEAAGSFNSAIRQRPEDYQSYYYLGRTQEAMKNYHAAVKEYRTALRVMDNSLAGREDADFRVKVLEGLAASVAAGDSEALEQSAFAGGKPTTGDDFFVLAKVRRMQGDADSALEAFAQAAAANPKSLPIAREHGLYLLELNQRTNASRELRRAYTLNYRARNPDDADINAGLKKLDVVPGPSLVHSADLAKPIIPQGPIPEPQWTKPEPDGQAATPRE